MFTLTEDIVRTYTTTQSFERGREIYRSGALHHAIRDGNILLADCEGTDTYHLRVELDEGGIRSSVCTCSVGGLCKHLVALLLTHLHSPGEFIERKGLAVLLENVEKADLLVLLSKIAAQHPELYEWIEAALPPTSPKTASQPRVESRVSESIYRKRIKNILRVGGYNDYGATYGVSQELDAVSDSVEELLQSGDAQGAVTVLLILLDELYDAYENFDDSDGELGDCADHAGFLLAEAILSADWTPAERKALERKLAPVAKNLADYGIEDGLEMAQLALQYGWNEPEEGEEDWVAELDPAKLNVLERQGDSERFLKFCQQHGEFLRYALKLLELGRVDESIRAADHISTPDEILQIAKALREANRLQDAISLAERGLALEGQKYQLALWLAPLEESRGRIEQALQTQIVLFAAMPSLEAYKNIQRLAGERWEQLRAQQMEIALKSNSPDALTAIYLYEEQWDQAIAIADKHMFDYNLREKVADAVITHRPEWVIQVSIHEAEKLIEPTQSKYYPHAARWLAKAKQAYTQTGRKAEWLAYFNQLKATYARRPSLQKELGRL